MANQISTSNTQVSNPASASQTPTSPTTTQNQKSKKRFHGKPTGARTSSTSSNKPNQNSRNAKRARWAKKNKPTPRPAVNRGPVKEYVCDCHGEPARKPKSGTKVTAKDPETGKMKDKFLGLGKWRCATTGKVAKVSPRKPQPKENPYLTPEQKGAIAGLKIDPFPGKLQTPVLAVPVAEATTGS